MKRAKRKYSLGSSNFSVSMPAELLLELNKLANRSGVSRNKLINHSIEEMLKKEGANPSEAKLSRKSEDIPSLQNGLSLD